MLRPRIIPCLLVKDNGLVKTTKFKDPKYVGDPINTVRIFNEKEVDELIVLDIQATINETEPNYQLIENLAYECNMPLCIGGGIRTLDQITNIISLGVEKVSICSAAIESNNFLLKAVDSVGGQSITVCLDLKFNYFTKRYSIYSHSGRKKNNINISEYISKLNECGIGEILINFIDRDGTMKGYDYQYINRIKELINTPLTILGGAGAYDDISSLFNNFGIIGAAAGSLFVFNGKYRAVLLKYPNQKEKNDIFS